MNPSNSQYLLPFETGMDALVKKWFDHGYCYCLERGGYVVYDDKQKFVCDMKTIRAFVSRNLAGQYAIPVNENKFQAQVVASLIKLPLVVDTTGVYRPDVPSKYIQNGDGRSLINTCKTYIPQTPESPDDIQLIQAWLNVMEHLFPNQQERKRVIQFIAHALQKPMEKPSFALLITGAQGNGKSSMIKDALNIVLGKTYCTTFNNVSQLSTSIGAQRWGNRLYCFVDDFADQTERTSEKLKSVITQMDTVVKKLYVDEQEIDVITRFVFISNEHQPIPFYDGHDRRYYAPAYAPARDVADIVDPFLQALKNDPRTRDALFRYLMAYDISDFNPHVPEETDNHRQMVRNSTNDVVEQLGAIMAVENPTFINRNWYTHKLAEYFDVPGENQLLKQWKQVTAYLTKQCGWVRVRVRVNTKFPRRRDQITGLISPQSDIDQWKQWFEALSEDMQAKWLIPISDY
ncbi:TPA: hypothetical protein OB631_004976 [Escherichia coli]|nr:hypothetical protein [Escherichia coli]